jgi:Spy/CpxP family protein refolding chaperone
MRRSTLIFAAAMALAATAVVHAQAPAGRPAPGPNRIARVMRASVAGIQLTDAEKAALASLRARYTPRFKAIGDSAKPYAETLRLARESHDTAAVKAARTQLGVQRRRGLATMRTALVDVRASLATEHRARFDQNLQVIRVLVFPGATGPIAADR